MRELHAACRHYASHSPAVPPADTVGSMQRAVSMRAISAHGLIDRQSLSLTRMAARGAQFACQPSVAQCAVCHPLEKLRCLACSPPFAVSADGLCGVP